jgi:hypothetical protein
MRYGGHEDEDCDEIPERDWDEEWRDYAADRLLYWKSPTSYILDPSNFIMTEEEEDFWDNEVPVRRIRLSDGVSAKSKPAKGPEGASYRSPGKGKENKAFGARSGSDGGRARDEVVQEGDNSARQKALHDLVGADGKRYSSEKWSPVLDHLGSKLKAKTPLVDDDVLHREDAPPSHGGRETAAAGQRCACVHVCVCVCVCVSVHVCMFTSGGRGGGCWTGVCLHVCVCVCLHAEREREMGFLDRDMCTHTHTHTHTHTRIYVQRGEKKTGCCWAKVCVYGHVRVYVCAGCAYMHT